MRERMLRPLMVVSCLVFIGCGGEGPATAIDPACAAGIYPAAPSGAASLLHVSTACEAALADGSAAHPYVTISEALAKAEPGAAILIAPGTYPEDLTVSQDVALVGSSDATSPEAAAVEIHSAVVSAAEEVTLRGLRVVGAYGAGILVKGASVTIEGCSIENTAFAKSGVASTGSGVVSTENGAIILQNSAVIGSAGMGVYVGSARAIILQSSISGSGGPGLRIDLATDQVRIEGSTIEKSTQMGIGVFSSRAIILQSVIKDTKLDAAMIGDGVIVAEAMTAEAVPLGPSYIEMSGTEITGNARVGLLCSGGTRGIILQKNTIQQNGGAAPFGAGVWIQGSVGGMEGNIIEDNALSANKFLGLGMTGETQGIILQNNTISGTTLGTTFSGLNEISVGDGIGVFAGASAQILGNTVKGNGRMGLFLDAAGAATTIQKNAFQDNDQYGIILQNQMNPPSTVDNTYSGNLVGETSVVAAGTFGVRIDGFAISVK